MKTLAKISDFAGKYMAIIALAVAMIALVFPAVSAVKDQLRTSCWRRDVRHGHDPKLADFKVVFAKPKAVIVGILAQFVIMPVLAFLLTMVFQLPPELAVGVILVGSCPGGTSSNVMTYLAKGDVALSVGMTACTTIMAPIVTPLLVLLFAGQTVDVNVVDMFLSIVQVVLVPIALGFLINYFFEKAARAASAVLPLVSVVGISLIIMAVVAANQAKLLTVGPLVIAVVMLHNLLGYALGYLTGRALSARCARCPSRWACRTPAWPPRSPRYTSQPCRWLRCPVPCSACGTTSPAQCTRTFSPARPAKTPSRRTRLNRPLRSGRTLPREGPREAHERSLPT